MQAKKTLACVVAALMLAGAGGVAAGDGKIDGKCVKVIDGDTLVVKCDAKQRTVEIDGIDAPELEQPWGKEVRGFVRNMVGGEKVELEIIEADALPAHARFGIFL